MTDEVLEDPGGLVKFVVPYSNNDGEFLGVVTQEDVEYDAKNRVYHCKYYLFYLNYHRNYKTTNSGVLFRITMNCLVMSKMSLGVVHYHIIVTELLIRIFSRHICS